MDSLIKLLCFCGITFSMGCSTAMTGISIYHSRLFFPTSKTNSHIPLIFVSKALGSLIGYAISCLLFKRFNQLLLTCIFLFGLVINITIMSRTQAYLFLLFVIMVQGFSTGVLKNCLQHLSNINFCRSSTHMRVISLFQSLACVFVVIMIVLLSNPPLSTTTTTTNDNVTRTNQNNSSNHSHRRDVRSLPEGKGAQVDDGYDIIEKLINNNINSDNTSTPTTANLNTHTTISTTSLTEVTTDDDYNEDSLYKSKDDLTELNKIFLNNLEVKSAMPLQTSSHTNIIITPLITPPSLPTKKPIKPSTTPNINKTTINTNGISISNIKPIEIKESTIWNFTKKTTIQNLLSPTHTNPTNTTTTTTTLLITRPDFINSNNNNHHKDFASGHAIKQELQDSLKKNPIDTNLNDDSLPIPTTTTTTTPAAQLNNNQISTDITLNNNNNTSNNNTDTSNNNTDTSNNNIETNNNATTNNIIKINNELNKDHINDKNNNNTIKTSDNNNNTIKTSDNNDIITSSIYNTNNNNTYQKLNNSISDEDTTTTVFHPPPTTPITITTSTITAAITQTNNTETRSQQPHPTNTTASYIDNKSTNNTIEDHNDETFDTDLNKDNKETNNVNNNSNMSSNMNSNTGGNTSSNTSSDTFSDTFSNTSSNNLSVIGCVGWAEGVSNHLTFANIPYYTGYAGISLVIFVINILLVIANKMSPKIGVYRLLSDNQYNLANQTQLTNTMLLMTPCRLFVTRVAICLYHLSHSFLEVVFAGVYLVMLWSVPGVTVTTGLVIWGVMWIWCFLGKLACLLLTHTFTTTTNILNIIGLVAFFLSSVSFYPIFHHPFSQSIPCLPLACVLFSNSFFFSFIDPSIIHHYNKLNLIPALQITQALSNFVGELIPPTIVTYLVIRSGVNDYFFHALTILSAVLLLSFILIHLAFRPFILPKKQSPKNKTRKMGYKKQRLVNTAWFDNGGVDDDGDDDDDDEQDEFVRSNMSLNMTSSPSKPLLLE